jgi:hypothetical protein
MSLRSAAMVLAFTAAAAAPAWTAAQSTGPSPSQSGVQAVLACQSVKGDKAQLACFRQAAKLLTQEPEANPQSQAATAETVEALPPRPFGAPPPRVHREAPAEERSAMLVVRSIGDLGDGRAILNLADGSSWVETEPEPITSAVKPGDSVRLEKGVLGGYLLVLPHRSVIRMRRLRTD